MKAKIRISSKTFIVAQGVGLLWFERAAFLNYFRSFTLMNTTREACRLGASGSGEPAFGTHGARGELYGLRIASAVAVQPM